MRKEWDADADGGGNREALTFYTVYIYSHYHCRQHFYHSYLHSHVPSLTIWKKLGNEEASESKSTIKLTSQYGSIGAILVSVFSSWRLPQRKLCWCYTWKKIVLLLHCDVLLYIHIIFHSHSLAIKQVLAFIGLRTPALLHARTVSKRKKNIYKARTPTAQ